MVQPDLNVLRCNVPLDTKWVIVGTLFLANLLKNK